MSNNKHTIDVNKVLIGNQGFMKINNIEIAELKELSIKIVPQVKTFELLNSATRGKIITSYDEIITFELNKIYSRFKPAILDCAKNLRPFVFALEATVYEAKYKNKKHKQEETISITACWMEGDMELFALKSDADFLTEKYAAGFKIESVKFLDTIDDGEDEWASLTNM